MLLLLAEGCDCAFLDFRPVLDLIAEVDAAAAVAALYWAHALGEIDVRYYAVHYRGRHVLGSTEPYVGPISHNPDDLPPVHHRPPLAVIQYWANRLTEAT